MTSRPTPRTTTPLRRNAGLPARIRPSAAAFDDTPPLTADGNVEERRPRQQLNIRWLSTTLLTGLAGGALLSGALFIAFDRQYYFADEIAAESDAAGQLVEGPSQRKTDRVTALTQTLSTRQIIHDTAVRRVEDKEFIGVQAYVRVTSGLVLNATEFADAIPEFDPLRLYAEAAEQQPEPAAERVSDDSAVAISVGDFPFGAPIDDAAVDDTQAIAILNEAISIDPNALAYAAAGAPGAFTSGDDEFLIEPGEAGFAATPAAEAAPAATASPAPATPASTANVTVAEKNAVPVPVADGEEVVVAARAGDSMMSLLIANGSTRDEAAQIVAALGNGAAVAQLAEGREVRLLMAPSEQDGRMRPVRVTLVEDGVPAATAPTVALAMTGNFVPVAASVIGGLGLRPALPEAATAAPSRATVHESIYATALKNDVPADMIRELVRIMSFDVDFQRPVSPGDSLDIFFSEDDVETGEEGKPTILYAAINVRGETHEFYRFRTPDDGFVDYYDSAGKSAKKFLVRKPMTGGVFRSGFGMRRHPILGYRKMHSGVDWAAPRGTPIVAAGNGTVEFANWKSGYGKHVAIRHANGYTTTYSHMSGFAQGMAAGVRVRQGQVIGYVGSTGLSTGNHLHYEVIVNGRFVDPMRIRLPRGRVLDGRYLAAFEREKQRIEALRMKPPASTRLAAVSE